MDDAALRAAASARSAADACAELLAAGVIEHSHSRGLTMTVRVHGRHGDVSDDGPGMRLAPDRRDTISHAQRELAGIAPCPAATADVDAALRDPIRGERGSLGRAVADPARPHRVFVSDREGEVRSPGGRQGSPCAPPVYLWATDRTGTTMRSQTVAEIDVDDPIARCDALVRRCPDLHAEVRRDPGERDAAAT